MADFSDKRPVRQKNTDILGVNEPTESSPNPNPPKIDESDSVDDFVDDFSYEESTPNLRVGNIIDLPSKGKLDYPGQITYREIMAGDEEILKTSTTKNFHRTVNSVIKSICNDAEFFDNMSVHDRDYIMTWIWANTYGKDKQFEVKCRHCGQKDKANIDITEIPVLDIKDNIKKSFDIYIKKADKKIKVRMITVRDENNAEKFMADNPKLDYTREFITTCLAVNFGMPMSTEDRVNWVKENVSAKEFGTMKQYHSYFKFGMDTTHEHVCSNSECKGVTRGNIPFHAQDIIAPEVRTDFEELLRSD